VELTPPRGTQDLLPPEAGRMRSLYDLASKAARLYGYRYVETPAFELTELFRRSSGETSDVVRKEMYTFEDRGGRLLTLRPEATAPIMRAYLERGHGLPGPFKVFTIEPMWRYGRPQSGRLREFRQFNVEVIAEAGSGADVDVIALGNEFLMEAGIGTYVLQINSIGDENCRPAYRTDLVEFLRSNRDRLRDEHRDRFEENPLRVLDCKDEACRAVASEAPKIVDRLCGPCREHFDAVREGLIATQIEAVLNPTLVRGLDYYTRTTFEWVSPHLASGQDSVGGGGRYDGLAEVLGGPRTPGVGFAIGLERVLMLLEREQPQLDLERPHAFVVAVGEVSRPVAHDVASKLRSLGVSTDQALEVRPLGTQLKMADRSGAQFAVIVGEREAAAGTVTLRRMSDGHQEELPLDEAVKWIATQGERPT
jgi:histidyl-tRNA synthetase